MDPDLVIRYVNRTFEETFGYEATELRGQSMAILYDDAPETAAEAQEIIEHADKDRWSGEVLRKTKTGELLNILLTVTPVKDNNGKVIGRISVSRNITERKKTEAYLNEQNRLAALGQLAAGVAHEINNPLTNILLGSQLLAESTISEESKADLNIISDAAQRAARIVKGLLLFARREDYEPEPMALDLIVDQALELKKYDFRTNNIKMALDLEADLPDSLVDEHQMTQVVLNILNNAEHALKKRDNGGEITIRTSSTPGFVVMEISDDGPGIEAGLLSKIFEPFFTTKKAGEGTGLGLSICHGIVQQHQGEMWVTSKEGQGASFFVRLPVSDGAHVAHSALKEAKEPGGASKFRILVVDDEPEIMQLVAHGLGGDLMMVDQAENGETALEKIAASSYDCILLDLKMPGISGEEVYERTLSRDPGVASRIVFMTGDTARPETASFLSGVSNTILNKPFTLDEVREMVSSVTG